MSDIADFVSQLRSRLKDKRVGRTAFRFSCVDQSATDCLLSITRAKMLTTQVLNGRDAVSLSVSLEDPQYNTLRKLIEYLGAVKGYTVAVDRDYAMEHPSSDLELVGTISMLNVAVPMRHHLFTDEEYEDIVALACSRHNVSYNPANVPQAEVTFVLQLAHSIALRDLAGDAIKRNGMEFTAEKLMELSRDIEQTYKDDVKRNDRVLPKAIPIDVNEPGKGDVVVSSSWRRALRTGYLSPIAAAGEITKPLIRQPEDWEIEDVKVTISWARNRDLGFYSQELWRDTVPIITRPEMVFYTNDVPSLQGQTMQRQTSARLVFRSAGPHSNWEHVGGIVILNEEGGQTITKIVDAGISPEDPQGLGPATAIPLEPETTYYYRLFVVNLNDEVVGSNVVVITTKAMRAQISQTVVPPISPVSGGPGTVITVLGTNFSPTTIAKLGGLACATTFVSSTELTFVAPNWQNPQSIGMQMDVEIVSGDTDNEGLIDIYSNGFERTS